MNFAKIVEISYLYNPLFPCKLLATSMIFFPFIQSFMNSELYIFLLNILKTKKNNIQTPV